MVHKLAPEPRPVTGPTLSLRDWNASGRPPKGKSPWCGTGAIDWSIEASFVSAAQITRSLAQAPA